MPLGNTTGSGGTSANAIQAGEAFVKISAQDELSKTLDNITSKMKATGLGLTKIGLGVSAIGVGVLAPIAKIFKDAVDYGSEIEDTAQRVNTTAEAVQRLGYAAKLSDASLEDVLRGNTLLTKAAVAATEGTENQANAFKQLGIDAEEFLALEADDRILVIASALETMTSDADKANLLFTLLGKSAVTLLPLLKSGSKELSNMFRDADRFAISSEDAARAGKVGDSIDKIWNAVKMTMLEVGFAIIDLADGIDTTTNTVLDHISIVRDWLKSNKETVLIVTALGAGFVALGGTIMAVGLSIAAMGIALQAIFGVMKLVIGQFILMRGVLAIATAMKAAYTAVVTAATAALTAFNSVQALTNIALAAFGVAAVAGVVAWYQYTESGQEASEATTQFWKDIQEDWAVGIEGIKKALEQGKIDKAWDIALTSLKILWLDFRIWLTEQLNAMSNSIDDFVTKGIAGWKIAFHAAKDVLMGRDWKVRAREILNEVDNELESRLGKRVKDVYKLEDLRHQLRFDRDAMIAGLGGNGVEIAPDPRELRPSSMGKTLAQLGEAVRGTFGSRDYRGSLGLGPAAETAKKSLKVQQDMRDFLKVIKDKVDVPVFDD